VTSARRTVAQVNRQNGVITLQDGRTVTMGGQSFVWQDVKALPRTRLQSGSRTMTISEAPAG
jgi:hypothetical protein